MFIINRSRKSQICHNIVWILLLDELFIILDTFDSFSTMLHVYKARNSKANSLFQACISLDYGKWMIT
jgi:hypothetical protein